MSDPFEPLGDTLLVDPAELRPAEQIVYTDGKRERAERGRLQNIAPCAVQTTGWPELGVESPPEP